MNLPENITGKLKPLPEEIKARLEANLRKLTPEQITEELKWRAEKVKKQIKQLKEAQKISPEVWLMRVTI